MRPDVGTWGGPYRATLGDAASEFAAKASQLAALARTAYAAKQVNDGPTYATAMNQFRRTLAALLPQQQQDAVRALAADMPSQFLQDLAGFSDRVAGLFKNPVTAVLIVAGLYLFITYGATRGMDYTARGRREW